MNRPTLLLLSPRFWPLFVTQFLGALNDNVIKNAVVVLLTFQTTRWTRLTPEVLANLAAGVFILPFFLFSAIAGQLADKYDKASLARLAKALEVAIVLVVGVAFWLHSLELLMIALFLLGLQSTLFGPVKYAILPQHLNERELVGGNASIEAGTFVAILLGTLLGGLLAATHGATTSITLVGLIIALVGLWASWRILPAPPPVPTLAIDWQPLTSTWRALSFARENRTVFLSIVGISWFWLYGALLLTQLPAYTKNVLGGDETVVTLLLALFTLGIGLGSLLCERLSAGRVELALVPLGALGLTLFGLDLALASPASPAVGAALGALALLAQAGTWRLLLDLILIGVFGGCYIVPLYALVQQRASEQYRARVIAANNILNALFMVVGALAAAALLANGGSIPELLVLAAVGNAAVAVYIFGLVPEFLVRAIVWLRAHGMFRLRSEGLERIPAQGAALLDCRGMTASEALLLIATSHRPIRFVLPRAMTDGSWTGFVFRQTKAIWLDDAVPMGLTLGAIQQALADGALMGWLGGELAVPPNVPRLRVTVSGQVGLGARIELRIMETSTA